MNPNQIVEKVLHSKNYKNYPKSFVKKIVLKNLNKQDPLKSSKLQLHEISAMFRNLNREKDVALIWNFVNSDVGSFESVLDLGCGKDYESFKNLDIKYTGIDIDKFEGTIQDDVLNPSKDWKDKNYDLVLILNVVPVIERIEKNAGKKLIESWKGKSKFLVVSFPLYSLGNKKYIGAFWKNYVKSNFPDDLIEVVGRELVLILRGKG